MLRYAALDAVFSQTSSRAANATYTSITPVRPARADLTLDVGWIRRAAWPGRITPRLNAP